MEFKKFNKFKKFKLQSIRVKLIVILLLICLVPVAGMGITIYSESKSVLRDKLETTSKQTILEVNRGIDNYFIGMSKSVELLSNNINFVEVDDKEEYFKFAKMLMMDVKNSDEDILNVFMGTEKGKFHIYPEANTDANYDYKSRPWYKLAMENKGQLVITPPYKSATTGENVVTVAKTIEKNNNAVGVIGLNVSLKNLSDGLSKIKVGNEGYMYVSDANGNLVAHPNKEIIGTDEAAKLSVWSDISSNKEGFTEYKFNGESKFAVYTTSQLTDWKIVASLDDKELLNDTQYIQYIIMLTLGIIALIAIVVSLIFSNSISKNINKLLTAFNKIKDGDLRVKVNIKSRDEFKELGESFNGMIENVSYLIKSVNESSNTVLETSSNLSAIAEETSASISEVARAIEDVSGGAIEQANSAQDGSTAMIELSENLKLLNEATEAMSAVYENANQLSNRGLSMVDTLIEKSNDTKVSTTKVSELVIEMDESTGKINSVSDTISQITEQTNLLSLNASIEAARAGEAGRGFAVVAEEIRKLAEQSKDSTMEIKKIVDDIKNKTNIAVVAIKDTGKIVEEQEGVVDEAKAVFNDIMTGMRDLINKVTEISDYIVVIDRKKDNVVAQIENISSISQETAASSEEVTASTEEVTGISEELTGHANELQQMSEKLQEMINTFKFE
ncbi:methyl-accepting chemotaxis protein [uncultured Clostridium sp.]|uniref:methyl-accepting chemotaxis protein n=1 Tax=uncultured Clostridium sp. TaxID=59620 RepID=UPI00321724F1